VFGSLGATGQISETTPYAPRSPYSASKVASEHFVKAWHHTYDPWQFPKKLIYLVILKAAAGEPISLYGDGLNVRDWLYGDDYVDAPCCWRPAGVSWPQLLRGRPRRTHQQAGGGSHLQRPRWAAARWNPPCAPDQAGHRSLKS
jgi:hypothetical protein